MTEQERPPVDLEQIRQGFAWVDGYWRVKRNPHFSESGFWITGPYDSEEAAANSTFEVLAVIGKGYDEMEGPF